MAEKSIAWISHQMMMQDFDLTHEGLSLAANVQLQDEYLALVILARQPLVRQVKILHHHLM